MRRTWISRAPEWLRTLRPDALAALILGFILRLLAVPAAVGDVDSVNFARALRVFDPAAQSPHFPGYPVYVAAARLFSELGVRSDTWALALPGIVTWPLAGLVLYIGLRRRFGTFVALAALVITALAPAAVLTTGWPASDGLGLSLLAAGIGFLALRGPRAGIAGGIVMGLLLGVRLSWWPLCVLGLWWRRDALVATVAACAAWFVPLVALTGPATLVDRAIGFTAGHFGVWGGSALTSSAGIPERVAAALDLLVLTGLGWPALIVAGVVLIGLGAAPPSLRDGARRDDASPDPSLVALRYAAIALAVYSVWWVGFQNVGKIRHLVPLLPVVGIAIGAALSRVRSPQSVVAALAIALVAVSLPRAWTQRDQLVPAAAMVAEVHQRYEPGQVVIFAGEEARVFEHHAPSHRVIRPASADVLRREAQRLSAAGVEVLISSGAPGAHTLALSHLLTFSIDRHVRSHDAKLTLSRFVAPSQIARSWP